ncbi:hypothetical protein Tco_0978967 [Tanacetum coccineum]|uniref:Uncharacterized protein n=1 Tax=Tanacetum coccineum TaxID=301880 RepID=A0ABQ5EPF0_9ASTR
MDLSAAETSFESVIASIDVMVTQNTDTTAGVMYFVFPARLFAAVHPIGTKALWIGKKREADNSKKLAIQPVIDHNMFDQMSKPVGQYSNSPNRIASNHASPRVGGNASPLGTLRKYTIRSISVTTKTPLIGSPGNAGGVDEDEEIYKKVSVTASLTINELKHYEIWSLELWKWCKRKWSYLNEDMGTTRVVTVVLGLKRNYAR